MKQGLLEYLIRECAKEVLEQVTSLDEADPNIVGASAPPADGQGTAEQPPIPNEEPEIPEEPQQPQTPPAPNLKGIILIDPRDKSKLQKLEILPGDDTRLERQLHTIAFHIAGGKAKIALSTMRAVKDAVRNAYGALFLYFGKTDPESEEVFLMADKSLQVAKDASVPPEELPSYLSRMSQTSFNPLTAKADDFAHRLASGGQRMPEPVNENLVKAIKVLVNQMFDSK